MAVFAIFGRWNERRIRAGEIARTVGYVESSTASGRRCGRIKEGAEEAISRRHRSGSWLRGNGDVKRVNIAKQSPYIMVAEAIRSLFKTSKRHSSKS